MSTGPPRTFPYVDAKQLRADGFTYREIGELFGVTDSAIQRAVNDDRRARMQARTDEYQRSGTCPDCGGPASRNATRQHRCRACASKIAATSVQEGSLQCVVCKLWFADEVFPKSRIQPHRRGRHQVCRNCQAEVRQHARGSRMVPCVNCGNLRLHPKDTSNRPGTGLCRACYDRSRP